MSTPPGGPGETPRADHPTVSDGRTVAQPHPGPGGWHPSGPVGGPAPYPPGAGPPMPYQPAPGPGPTPPPGWSAPNLAQPYGTPGAWPGHTGATRRRAPQRWIAFAVIAASAVVIAVVLALLLGRTTMDARAVEQGVQRVATIDLRHQVVDVRCPDGQAAAAGTQFTCDATVDGSPRQIPVTVTDDQGDYEVDQPR